jgi:hypothetical protein
MPPVGYVSFQLVEGFNTIAVTFTKPVQFTGVVSSATRHTLTLASVPRLTGKNHYLEVVSSSKDIVGERIDIASVSGNVLHLDIVSPHNTLPDAELFIGDTGISNIVISIREHFTIGDFGASIDGDVYSRSFNLGGSDHLLQYDNGYKRYLHFEGDWYAYGGSNEIATNVIIAPGTGLFYYRNPEAEDTAVLNVTIAGSVRTNEFVQKFVPGYQFVANGYPVDASPSDFGYGEHLQSDTNFGSGNSDSVLVWDNGGFKTYLPHEGQLRKYFETNEVVDDDDLFTSTEAHFVFVKKKALATRRSRKF